MAFVGESNGNTQLLANLKGEIWGYFMIFIHKNLEVRLERRALEKKGQGMIQ
jgi:hypothetical protein